MCEYLSSVPNLWMHELQSEQFKKLFSFSVDDNFLNMLFCTETQPRRIESPEESKSSDLWGGLYLAKKMYNEMAY